MLTFQIKQVMKMKNTGIVGLTKMIKEKGKNKGILLMSYVFFNPIDSFFVCLINPTTITFHLRPALVNPTLASSAPCKVFLCLCEHWYITFTKG